jgi:hypothetical protein
VTVALVIILVALGAVHAAWGFGSHWPGRNEADLVSRVIGRTRTGKMPPPVSCAGVAVALFVAAVLAAQVTAQSPRLLIGAYYACAGIFLLRGLVGLFSPVWRYAAGTPFHRLNRLYYSPLCLLIAGLFIANGMLENVR